MYELWTNGMPYPAIEDMQSVKDAEYVTVHDSREGEYQFMLGAAIIKHKGAFYCSWANSFRGENDDNTILAQKQSFDGGKTWQNYVRLSDKTVGFGRSHGVYLEHDGELYAFCPKAKFKEITHYPELKTECYRLSPDGSAENLGIVIDVDFWPMCQPIKLDDGGYLMAGLKAVCTLESRAAFARCDGSDITKWEVSYPENPENYDYWGESTVIKLENKLLAIIRGGMKAPCALVSESFDGGRSWTPVQKTNMPAALSKMYALNLSDGRICLVYNTASVKGRDTLCIATGKESFDKVYTVRHGFDAPPKFGNETKPWEWCYPYAYEDVEARKLYVAYSKHKEDCELCIIPIDSLAL